LRSGQKGRASRERPKRPQADHQAAPDQVVDRAGDDGVEGLGDDRAEEARQVGSGEIVTEEADQATDLEHAPQQHATDAGGILQGLDQGNLELVEHVLQPAGQRESERGGVGSAGSDEEERCACQQRNR
jgi:hypothetical protein